MFFYNELNNELSEDVQQVYTSWLQANKLTASDKESGDRFGTSVSVSDDGSTIVVGAPNEDLGNLSNAGSAYVFTKTGSIWTEQKITTSDKGNSDFFGYSVSVSGDGSIIVVGAYNEDPNNISSAGSAYIFTKTGDTWTEVQKITASDKAANDRFGNSVSVSGDGSIIVVGASEQDPGGVLGAGSSYVFAKTGDTWTEVQKITASDKGTDARFGTSVSVSGDGSTIAIGARLEHLDDIYNAGSAYIFTKSDNTWTQAQKITASDKAISDEFGTSVSVSDDGSVIVVGARLEDPDGVSNAGSAYVFTKTDNTWTEVQKITASDKTGGDSFGCSVAISSNGSTIVVAASNEDPNGISNAGSAYVFAKNGATWTEVQKITASDKAASDGFGWSVSLSGDSSAIVIGAYLEDPDGISDAGSVYVFQGQ